jgi:hypothetical protein
MHVSSGLFIWRTRVSISMSTMRPGGCLTKTNAINLSINSNFAVPISGSTASVVTAVFKVSEGGKLWHIGLSLRRFYFSDLNLLLSFVGSKSAPGERRALLRRGDQAQRVPTI